jgi:hypothetical protein
MIPGDFKPTWSQMIQMLFGVFRLSHFMLIVSPKKVVGWRGGNQNVEGDLLTIGYLMLNDSLGYPYYRLINV